MTTVVLSLFGVLIASIASLIALSALKNVPEAVEAASHRVATLERHNVDRLDDFVDGLSLDNVSSAK